MYCKFCGRRLVAVGNARSNGKSHNDWTSREYHKKCWKQLRDFKMLELDYKF